MIASLLENPNILIAHPARPSPHYDLPAHCRVDRKSDNLDERFAGDPCIPALVPCHMQDVDLLLFT